MKSRKLSLQTPARDSMIEITDQIRALVRDAGVRSGAVTLFVPHTTAAVTINENADPDVVRDILHAMNKIVPWNDSYDHFEGNSAAHIKASMFGFSETVLIENGDLVLGTWQGIYFCEFDGPRNRSLIVKINPDTEA